MALLLLKQQCENVEGNSKALAAVRQMYIVDLVLS